MPRAPIKYDLVSRFLSWSLSQNEVFQKEPLHNGSMHPFLLPTAKALCVYRGHPGITNITEVSAFFYTGLKLVKAIEVLCLELLEVSLVHCGGLSLEEGS